MKKVVFVVAEQDFRDEELFHPKEVLEKLGFTCVVASRRRGMCTGTLGATIDASLSLNEVGPDFDAIVFVGGPGARNYFHNPEATGLARRYFDNGKIVAAICIAPVILANAGVLMGKRATAFSSEKSALVGKCMHFTGKQIEVDGRIITASGPSAARIFGEEIARKLE